MAGVPARTGAMASFSGAEEGLICTVMEKSAPPDLVGAGSAANFLQL
jgi:hypothetical protein